jgi:hypothetical protein
MVVLSPLEDRRPTTDEHRSRLKKGPDNARVDPSTCPHIVWDEPSKDEMRFRFWSQQHGRLPRSKENLIICLLKKSFQSHIVSSIETSSDDIHILLIHMHEHFAASRTFEWRNPTNKCLLKIKKT